MQEEQGTDLVHTQPKSNFIESKVAEAANRLQSAYLMAKKFPRNEEEAVSRIDRACKRWALAEEALYQFPRGTEKIEGPSIRLIEVIAQSWGNLDYGIQELENVQGPEGYSIVEGYCTDLETNNHQSKTFKVYHKMLVGPKGKKYTKHLDDPRDQYEHVANMGARRMRSAIQGCIPRYVVDAAVESVKATLRKGKDNKSLPERIDAMAKAFADIGVTVEMIERRLDHALRDTTVDELVDLTVIFNTLRKKEGERKQFFSLKDEPDEGGAAERLKARINGESQDDGGFEEFSQTNENQKGKQ